MNVEPEGPDPGATVELAGAQPIRKQRADAQRNRERLLEVAKAAFADDGPDVSLDEIARRAGVGIGTLYRHFPTRDAVVEEVYSREVLQLACSATRLLGTSPPGQALREWMLLFVDYIATKKIMASALSSIVGGPTELYDSSRTQIIEAMSLLVSRASAAGEIRPDIEPNDLLRALGGFAYSNTSPEWHASAQRLVDILMNGLRPPRAAD